MLTHFAHVPTIYFLKEGFWCFQGVYNGSTGQKCFKSIECALLRQTERSFALHFPEILRSYEIKAFKTSLQ